MKNISSKDMIQQLKYDLIGKDSYRGVTLTYSWLANQFGHFGLGFVPTYIAYVILRNRNTTHAGLTAALIVWGLWIAFETYNCIKPILFSHKATSVFPAPWSNIVYDVLTDLCFFGIGSFTAAVLADYSPTVLIILSILVVLVLYPSADWYRTKMYQQEAGYPFQYRLSQWASTCTEQNKQTVLDFIKAGNTPGNHLFVFGAYGSGKTSLSVAIANECSITHHACKYVTAMKLFSLFFEKDSSETIWNWRNADLLVIDDINPGFRLPAEIVSADAFLSFADHDGMGTVNKKALCEKKVIWVLGVENEEEKNKQRKWEDMITGLQPDTGIFVVNLNSGC